MQTFGPYSPVRRAGQTYYISGQIGADIVTKTVPTDIEAQTHLALQNMRTVLASAGLDMDDIVKTTIFLANMADFAAMNAVYETYFEVPRPARSTVAVKSLPQVAGDTTLLVEIEAVAYKEAAA
jgi:2-iminobutanoate/2-iminopropanoate deaminase